MSAPLVVETFRLAITQAKGEAELHRLIGAVYEQWGAGLLSGDDAETLAGLAKARRQVGRRSQPHTVPLVLSRFKPRRRQASPDKEASRRRRRGLARSAPMPASLASHFTESESAVLAIIAGEVKHHGSCALPIDQIAALAGVCRTSVQNALHEARRLGLVRITHRPQRGRKHLPNVVEIVSREWHAWLKRGPSAHRPTGSKTSSQVKNMSSTKNTEKDSRGSSRWSGVGLTEIDLSRQE